MTPIRLPEISGESPAGVPQTTIDVAVPEEEVESTGPEPEMAREERRFDDADQEMPGEEPVPDENPPEEPLLSLDEAVQQIPEDLRKQMGELLRAEFREVTRWHPPKGG